MNFITNSTTQLFNFSTKGFTIVEAVCAIAVLGMAMVSIITMFSIGTKARVINEQRIVAYNLARMKLEEAIARDWSTDVTANIPNCPDFTEYAINVTQQINPNGEFNFNTLKKINVTITWTSPSGDSISKTISTLNSKR